MNDAPLGWKLVPVEPTADMLDACKRALKHYLDAMPEAERVLRFGRKGAHGHRVDPSIKAASPTSSPPPTSPHKLAALRTWKEAN